MTVHVDIAAVRRLGWVKSKDKSPFGSDVYGRRVETDAGKVANDRKDRTGARGTPK
jgi:hypothetical protein